MLLICLIWEMKAEPGYPTLGEWLQRNTARRKLSVYRPWVSSATAVFASLTLTDCNGWALLQTPGLNVFDVLL